MRTWRGRYQDPEEISHAQEGKEKIGYSLEKFSKLI